ncbi:MAG: hypothetical protein R3D89_00210 [Sphingomonadaceae bacterium]
MKRESLLTPRVALGWSMLVVLALLLRAAIPAGWMPVSGPEGITVMLCAGDGPVEIVLPVANQSTSPMLSHDGHHDMPGHDNDSSPEREACAYALAFGQSLDLPPPPALATKPPVLREEFALIPSGSLTAGSRRPKPPATGPPALA